VNKFQGAVLRQGCGSGSGENLAQIRIRIGSPVSFVPLRFAVLRLFLHLDFFYFLFFGELGRNDWFRIRRLSEKLLLKITVFFTSKNVCQISRRGKHALNT
jgi:hypothetical protein